LFDIVDKTQSVEFYDFLQVDSNKSELTDNARKDDEEVNQDVVELQNKAKEKENNVPFIDFLSSGSC
jgi:myb proto-oncogene protein